MLYHRNKAFHQVHKFKLGFLVFSLTYRMKYCKKINFHYCIQCYLLVELIYVPSVTITNTIIATTHFVFPRNFTPNRREFFIRFSTC